MCYILLINVCAMLVDVVIVNDICVIYIFELIYRMSEKYNVGFIVISDVFMNIYSFYIINYFKWRMYVKVFIF